MRTAAGGWGRVAAIGVGTALLLLAAFLLTEVAMGRLPPRSTDHATDIRIAVIHCFLVGYGVAAHFGVLRSAERSRLHLRLAYPRDIIPDRAPPGRRALILSGGAGLLVAILAPYLTTTFPWVISLWIPEIYWHRILGLAFGWLLGWFSFTLVRESVHVSRVTEQIASIGVFDHERLAPVVRQGLSNALLSVGLLAVGSLFLLDRDQLPVVLAALGFVTPVAVLGLMLPVVGAHRRLRTARRTELEWSMQAIQGARASLREGDDDGSVGRLGGVSAYHRLVRDTSEWPFTGLTFARVVLYLLIPLASWAGGVALEGFVEGLVAR